jgi:hypothetical protein
MTKLRFLSVLSFVLLAVLGVVGAASARPARAPAAAGTTPIFYVIPPSTAVELLNPFHVGENVTAKKISFCWPMPKPGHLCGGSLNKGTLFPAGGTLGESYDFFTKGFLPFGLVLNFTNGNLQGTVKQQLSRTWEFQVCAYQSSGGGKSQAKCQPASISVVGAYDGEWQGALTGTYNYSWDRSLGPQAVPVVYDFDFKVVNGKYSMDGTSPSTTIGPNGNVSFTQSFSGDLTCSFQFQFYINGTASSGQTLSCQATVQDAGGTSLETFTGGAIHLKRSP